MQTELNKLQSLKYYPTLPVKKTKLSEADKLIELFEMAVSLFHKKMAESHTVCTVFSDPQSDPDGLRTANYTGSKNIPPLLLQ